MSTIVKTKAVQTEDNGLTRAQEALCNKFMKHATAELNAAENFYKALVETAKQKTHTVESIALCVKEAYKRAGAKDSTAGSRASEAKKVVSAIREKADGFNPTDYKRLQAAAKAAPAITTKGSGKGSTKAKKASPMKCLTNLEDALNALRESLGEDDDGALELIGELTDMAEALSDLLIEQATAKAEQKEAA